MRLLILVAVFLVVLAAMFAVRAIRRRRYERLVARGWYPEKIEAGRWTAVYITNAAEDRRILVGEANSFEPSYSDRLIELWAKAETKAEDRNTTNRALGA